MKRAIGICLILCLLLAGCRQPGGQTPEREPDPTIRQSAGAEAAAPLDVVETEGVYQCLTEPWEECGASLLLQPTAAGAAEIGLPMEDADSDSAAGHAVWVRVHDGQGGEARSIPLQEEETEISGCCLAGNFYLLVDTPEGQRLVLPDETRLSLADVFPGEAQWLVGSGENLLLLSRDGQAAALRQDGTLLWTERYAGELAAALMTADQQILLLTQWESMALLQLLDLSTGQLTSLGSVPEGLCRLSLTAGEAWGYTLLAWDSEALYGWRAGETTVDRLFSWDDLGLEGESVQTLACRSETELLGGYRTDGAAAVECLTISRTAAALNAWQQAYLDLLEQQFLSAGQTVSALGLTDLQRDGVPELVIWLPGNADGTVYFADGGAAYHNIGSIYPGEAPEADWVLPAPEARAFTESEIEAWLGRFSPDAFPALTDEDLLAMVEPLEIALAQCGEFTFDDPSQLSADQLWRAFLALADHSDFQPYRNSYDTGYVLPVAYIHETLSQYFSGVTFACSPDMQYINAVNEDNASMFWSETDALTGHRYGQVGSRRGDGATLSFTVDYYTQPEGQGTMYLTKTYEIAFGETGYTYQSARIESAPSVRELVSDNGYRPTAAQLEDDALFSMLLSSEVALVDEGFTFRNSCELGEPKLYLLFLLWTDYGELEACYSQEDEMFHFSQEMIEAHLAPYLREFSFDITADYRYDPAEGMIVTPLASGFGGDRPMRLLEKRVDGSFVEVDLGVYEDYEFQGEPKYVKTYTLQFHPDGCYILSAVRHSAE